MVDSPTSSSSSNNLFHHLEVQTLGVHLEDWIPVKHLLGLDAFFWMVTLWCPNWATFPLGYKPCLKINLKT